MFQVYPKDLWHFPLTFIFQDIDLALWLEEVNWIPPFTRGFGVGLVVPLYLFEEPQLESNRGAAAQ